MITPPYTSCDGWEAAALCYIQDILPSANLRKRNASLQTVLANPRHALTENGPQTVTTAYGRVSKSGCVLLNSLTGLTVFTQPPT